MVEKVRTILVYALPVIVMIGLIPLISNDYLLTAIYIAFIASLLMFKKDKHDFFALLFGFTTLTISEFFFITTGVETFERTTLFGVMPLWLPFLWAYGFVTINRCLKGMN